MRIGGQHVATLSALNNMCGNVGAAAFPLVVPVLLRSAAGWDAVLNVFVGLYLVASAAWLLMRDVKNPPVEVTSEGPNRCG
jgi:ACS family glucarate transporter-like MFS transporter/ACS family D-galactonate transporter-like MFS transporter